MILRSVVLRGPVPGSGLKMMNLQVTPKDIALSVLVRSLTSLKLTESMQYCSIKKLGVNWDLSQQKLDKSQPLDKCVAYILKEDIQVPEVTLMLNKGSWVLANSRSKQNIPDDVKLRRWSPIEHELIKNNMDTLVKGIRQRKNKDAVIQSIFTPSKLKWHKEKTNIVGCFLGQGLPDLRLPCEIFQRADTLFNDDLQLGQKIVFTESDDRTIVDYMEKNAVSDRTPYASLSKMLGYPRGAINKRYVHILKPDGKRKRKVVTGAYTGREDKEIMKTIFQDKKDALEHDITFSDPIWDKLDKKLNRRHQSLFNHWEGVIKPQILLFENGRDYEDIRHVLIEYFVDNGIRFRNETNWSEIVKDEIFKGTTPPYLQRRYSNLLTAFKKKNPGIAGDEITSEALLQYLNREGGQPRKATSITRLIEDYVKIKYSM